MSRLAFQLRALQADDPERFARAFAAIGWSKPRTLYEGYLAEQVSGERTIHVAEVEGAPVGYVTVVWRSPDPSFQGAGLPEIMDLNVLPDFRRRGIGTALLNAAEASARARADRVAIRVGLHPGYGSAQRLYVRRGYVPDGAGAVFDGEVVAERATVRLDDELTLRLVKSLTSPPADSYLAGLRERVGNRLLMVPSVAIVVRDTGGRLLLVRDRATGDWGIPAGAIEPGESPEAAARRELGEETGLFDLDLGLAASLGGESFRHVYPNGDRVEYQITVFVAALGAVSGYRATGDDQSGAGDRSAIRDQTEVDAVRFFTQAEAPRLSLPYPEEVLWDGAGSG